MARFTPGRGRREEDFEQDALQAQMRGGMRGGRSAVSRSPTDTPLSGAGQPSTTMSPRPTVNQPRHNFVIPEGDGRSQADFQDLFDTGVNAGVDMSALPRVDIAGAPPAAAGAGGGVPAPDAGAAPAGGATGAGFGGMSLDPVAQQGGTAFTGFNDQRALAGGDANSVKDGFRRVVGGLGLDLAGLSKEQVGGVLTEQVIPALTAAGIQARPGQSPDVIEVFSAERGWEPIDVVRNAGGQDVAFQWLDLMGQQGGAPAGGQTGGTGTNMLPGDLSGVLAGLGDPGSSDTMRQIQAYLDAVINGDPSLIDQDALASLIGGGRV